MKVLFWNVQGLGAVEKQVMVKKLVIMQKPDIFLLQETKCQDPDDRLVRSVWGSGNLG